MKIGIYSSAGLAALLPAVALAQPETVEPEPPPHPPEPAESQPKEPEFSGFEIEVEGGHSARIGGLVQADGRFFLEGDDSGTDTFVARRARLDLNGKIARYFEVRLHPELAGSRLVLLDAYVNLHFVDWLQLRLGKTKTPFGLELLRSPSDFAFPELGVPSLLVPNRDVGAMLHGKLFGNAVQWAAGVFNGVPDGANGDEDENDDKDVALRLFVRPFAPLKVPVAEGLGVGIATTFGEQSGALPAHRTPGRQTFFQYTTTSRADGTRTRVSPQAYFHHGPVGVLGEYVRTREHVSDDTGTRAIVTSSAWQVVGSVVIGGGAGYGGTEIDQVLDPERGTWGAVELAARYGEIDVDDEPFEDGLVSADASARRAKSYGAAVSWWFAPATRALVAYDRTQFTGGASFGSRTEEGVLVTRLQVGF